MEAEDGLPDAARREAELLELLPRQVPRPRRQPAKRRREPPAFQRLWIGCACTNWEAALVAPQMHRVVAAEQSCMDFGAH